MKAVAYSDVGKVRSINEDRVFYTLDKIGDLENLFILCDGMGGENAGDYASLMAVKYIKESIQGTKGELASILSKAISEANLKILNEAKADVSKFGMGTTLVLVSIMDNNLYAVNIGDSRLYILRNEKLRQVSRDHTLSEELLAKNVIEKYSLEYEENKHKLTRALGVFENIKADFFEIPLEGISKVLICSDGLSNMIDDEDIEHIIKETQDEVCAKKLIDRANANGGRDNVSAIVIYELGKAGDVNAT
jgi:serine/threonine protein phosphatase